MDQASMQAAVSVLNRMDIDKAEGGYRRRHRVYTVVAHAVVRLRQTGHKVVQVIRARPNEFGKRIAMVVLFT